MNLQTTEQSAKRQFYQCDVCHKYYHSRRTFFIHSLTHVKMRHFPCEECGKTLATKKSLQYHMLLHKDELPFTCEKCGHRMRYKGNLVRHMKTHERQEKRSVAEQQALDGTVTITLDSDDEENFSRHGITSDHKKVKRQDGDEVVRSWLHPFLNASKCRITRLKKPGPCLRKSPEQWAATATYDKDAVARTIKEMLGLHRPIEEIIEEATGC